MWIIYGIGLVLVIACLPAILYEARHLLAVLLPACLIAAMIPGSYWLAEVLFDPPPYRVEEYASGLYAVFMATLLLTWLIIANSKPEN